MTCRVCRRAMFPLTDYRLVYQMSEARQPKDLEREILRSIEHPIGTSRLSELASNAKRVAVLVDDMTRPTPVSLILPVILDELSKRGLRDEQVTIVVALGSHRPMRDEEIRRKVGNDVAKRYRVINSRFDDIDHLRYIGTSEDEVPIYIDEEVAGADFKIGIGSIVPHGAVGWSGGGKLSTPVSQARTQSWRFFISPTGLTEED